VINSKKSEVILTRQTDHVFVEGAYEPKRFFAEEFQQSTSIAHFYASGSPGQEPFRLYRRPVRLRVRYVLPWALRLGYGTSLALVAVATGWASYAWLFAHPSREARIALLSVEAAFVALSIFLLNVQHRSAVVQGKTQLVRVGFYAALAAMAIEPLLWAAFRQ
jgi:hypothetical protein